MKPMQAKEITNFINKIVLKLKHMSNFKPYTNTKKSEMI